MKWSAEAPANLALIKYMGKINYATNTPSNASFSYTLSDLKSYVELEYDPTLTANRWEALTHPDCQEPFSISEQAQQRFLKHLHYLQSYFSHQGHFIVRSNNTFPMACGLASSASSFAALTKAATLALCELIGHKPLPLAELATLCQAGSGSACRSLLGPWVLWQGGNVTTVETPYPHLLHKVVTLEQQPKSIATSEAHRRVAASALFPGRPQRAERRLQTLLHSLQNQQWHSIFEIVWQDFQDMHALFETSSPPFGYMTADTVKVLHLVRQHWQQHHDGPLATLDAGANVHLLFRPEQSDLAATMTQQFIQNHGYDVR